MDPKEALPGVIESDSGARRRTNRGLPLAFRIVAGQGVLTMIVAAMFLLLGRAQAMSALLAGFVVIVPSVSFAWRVTFARVLEGHELDAARQVLGSGVAKQLSTFGLLVVAFAWFRPEPMAFFATMIALQAVYWFAPVLARR